jgi:hypothetical protein
MGGKSLFLLEVFSSFSDLQVGFFQKRPPKNEFCFPTGGALMEMFIEGWKLRLHALGEGRVMLALSKSVASFF